MDDDLSYSRGTFVTSSGSGVSKYCLPRTISALESMVPALDPISDVPIEDKSSIWSMSYKSPETFSHLVHEGYRQRSSVCSWRESPETQYDYIREFDDPREYYIDTDRGIRDVNTTSDTVMRDMSSTISRDINTTDTMIRDTRHMTRSDPRTHTNPYPKQLTFRTYKGSIFSVPENSRFFIIKSYSILDVNASFTNNIWTSTELGNRRLNKAYTDLKAETNPGKIFLIFLVNSSGKFCGIAEMTLPIDYTKSSDIWVEQQRWKGIFPVDWLLIKDVPNRFFQHLRVPSNEYKPVTNSRDTQEIPFDVGVSMLKIVSAFKS